MTIMEMVRKFAERNKEKSEKYKQLEEDYRLHKILEERQKSSNQRELERYYHDKHEEQIKAELDYIRKKKSKEVWNSPHKILAKGTSILRDDRPILMEKNIFLDNKTKIPFVKGGNNMFFE